MGPPTPRGAYPWMWATVSVPASPPYGRFSVSSSVTGLKLAVPAPTAGVTTHGNCCQPSSTMLYVGAARNTAWTGRMLFGPAVHWLPDGLGQEFHCWNTEPTAGVAVSVS